MSQNNNVLVRSSKSKGWVTRRRARILVAQKRAWWNPDRTLQLNERDYRFESKGSHAHSGSFRIVPRYQFEESWVNTDAAVLRFEGGNAEPR